MTTATLERPEAGASESPLENSQESEPLFSREELRQFDSDDAEAGRRIGKILTTLFVYTLVAMSIVIWWTLKTVN